jgi:hypothetical protein
MMGQSADGPVMRYSASLLLFLAACNSPGRPFQGTEPVRLEVAGSTFDVRVRGELAEAIRVNPQYAPRLGPIGTRAAFAMAKVSGCEVEGVLGDQAVVTGVLDCSSKPDRANPLWTGSLIRSYDCAEVSGWAFENSGRDYADFDCSAY